MQDLINLIYVLLKMTLTKIFKLTHKLRSSSIGVTEHKEFTKRLVGCPLILIHKFTLSMVFVFKYMTAMHVPLMYIRYMILQNTNVSVS